MIIGLPKESKSQETRVAMTPAAVRRLRKLGHDLVVETQAGMLSGFEDLEYAQAGARIVSSAQKAFESANLVVKVKEPLEHEIAWLSGDQTLFTYLHLASSKTLTQQLMQTGVTALGYESLEINGELPLLTPMSEIAGSMAAIEGAHYLQRHFGGGGLLLSGSPGQASVKVLVLGGGTAGVSAAKVAAGMGAKVSILETDIARIRAIQAAYPAMEVLLSNDETLRRLLPECALVIGAVLLHSAKAPRLITREHLKLMRPGSVLVDIAVDQGGCAETTKPTTHAEPTYIEEGIVHYCVANMPGAFSATASQALSLATLPFIERLASGSIEDVIAQYPELRSAINIYQGRLVQPQVAAAHQIECDQVDI